MPILTVDDYNRIQTEQYTLSEKLKGFFKHIYMMCFSPHNVEWYRYTTAMKNYQDLHERANA